MLDQKGLPPLFGCAGGHFIRHSARRKTEFVLDKGIGIQDQQKRFFRKWIAKEAYLKYLGSGITDLKSVCIFDIPIRENTTTFLKAIML